jgi:hypothetical protein
MTASARAIIDLDVTGHHISRHLYGHFAEHLGRCIYDGFWVGEDSTIPNERGTTAATTQTPTSIRMTVSVLVVLPIIFIYPLFQALLREGHHAGRGQGLTASGHNLKGKQ